MTTTARELPEGLSAMAPGPALTAALAEVDLPSVSAFDSVVVLQAAVRALNYAQAAVFAACADVTVRWPMWDDELGRKEYPHEFASDEVRAALGLTRYSADKLVDFAWDAVDRLPQVHAAMAAGDLDEARAYYLCEWTRNLSDEHARAVCEALLPKARSMTTGELRDKIAAVAHSLDPAWAKREQAEALKERRVIGSRNPDGTANLAGYNLPADRAAAGCGRLDALARSAKAAGDPRRIDHLRAELFLGFNDGTYEGLNEAAILAHLAGSRPPTTDPDDGAPAAQRRRRRPADRPDYGRPADPDRDAAEAESADTDGDVAGPFEPDTADPEVADPAASEDAAPEEAAPEEAAPEEAAPEEPASEAGVVSPERRREILDREPPRFGVEVQVRLSTILGLDDHPGALAGHGPIHCGDGRDLVARLGGGQWRYALTDDHGRLITADLVRARPTGARARSWRSHAIVELQIPAHLLAALLAFDPELHARIDPDLLAAWLPVFVDIDRRARRTDIPTTPTTRTADLPARRCAATSRFANADASAQAAARPRPGPTSITRETTPRAARRSGEISAQSAATTIGSSTTAAGSCAPPTRTATPGPAASDTSTPSRSPRSSTTCPTPTRPSPRHASGTSTRTPTPTSSATPGDNRTAGEPGRNPKRLPNHPSRRRGCPPELDIPPF